MATEQDRVAQENKSSNLRDETSDEIINRITNTRDKIDSKLNHLEQEASEADFNSMMHRIKQSRIVQGASKDAILSYGRTAVGKTEDYVKKHPYSTSLIAGAAMLWTLEQQGRLATGPELVRWSEAKRRRMMHWGRSSYENLSSTIHDKALKTKATFDRPRDFGSDRALQLVTEVQEKVQESYSAHPIVFGLGIFGAGALLGSLLPISRKEKELIQPQIDQARQYVSKNAAAAIERRIETK